MPGKKVQITLSEDTQRDLDDLKAWSGLKPSALMSMAIRILHRNISRDTLDDGLVKDFFSLRRETDDE